MTRPLKFRFRRDGYWHFMEFNAGGLLWSKGLLEILPHFDSVVEFSACEQFTGLTDKNGREIYEGDVILSVVRKPEATGRQTAMIVFGAGAFYAQVIKTEPPAFRHYTPGEGMPMFHWGTFSQVIGNIHENPELVKP